MRSWTASFFSTALCTWSNSTKTAGVCEQKLGETHRNRNLFIPCTTVTSSRSLFWCEMSRLWPEALQWWLPHLSIGTQPLTETRHSQDVIGYDERSNPERLVWIANESKDITTHTHTHNNMWRTVLPPRTSTAGGNCCSTVVGLSVCIYILQHHCRFRLVALKVKPIASTITQSSAVSMQRPRPL